MTGGVSLAESVSMALAQHVGKAEAHRTIQAASRRAIAEHRTLADVLSAMPEVTKYLSTDDIARSLSADRYLGASAQFVRAALAQRAGRHKAG
jgi:3-carboxy-cis,cis-muconate cycloisomerase